MSRSLESTLRTLDRRARALEVLGAAAAVLGMLWMLHSWLDARASLAADERAALAVARADLELDLAERQSLRDLASRDLERAKANAATLSRSRRELFEGGLALSEERRLLEKQWEIMSTWIRVDEASDKVHLMKGDQTAESLPLDGARPRPAGGDARPVPRSAAIISKERFAHPERPRSDQVGGTLQWEPPQVGTSLRASALGEHVMFTREGLVLHGPPLKEAEHEAFPHLCLSLPSKSAARLYAKSFVGTKILLTPETR